MKNNKPSNKDLWLYGIHPVVSAVLNPNRQILEIITCDETFSELDYKVQKTITDNKTNIKIFDKKDLNKVASDYCNESSVHQGILARVKPLENQAVEDILGADKSIVVILDQITDPHNIGAIMRSAYLFGANAVIATDKNSPDETGILAKSASGALDKIPYIRVNNLKRCIDILKDDGFWTVGFDGDSDMDLSEYKPSNKTAIIMGSEGGGMRRLTKESCDDIVYINTPNNDNVIDSLNVSNATAIALFDIQGKIK